MKKVIIIKYGELSTKKDNINFFLNKLKENINYYLKDYEHEIYYDFGRMFVESDDVEGCVEKLKNVFGIMEVVIGYKDPKTNISDIEENVLKLIQDKSFKTFKVITKRSDKTYEMDSMEVSKTIGGVVLKNISDIRVDVHNPELEIHIEIRKNEILYYFNGIKGLGGYPVGTLEKGLIMLSGGIDSPVAAYEAIKRGVKLEAIYFESPPHTSEAAKDKVKKLCQVLAKYNMGINLHVINFTEIQETILKNINHEYLITIMRRMMYRISARLARKRRCRALINGESIGQVASQTLTSMSAINEVTNMPVIRPVACFDKLEIIGVAKKIGTYDISILPYEDCCTIFVPKHPVINPDINLCHDYEELIDVDTLVDMALKNEEIIKINESEEKKYEDIL